MMRRRLSLLATAAALAALPVLNASALDVKQLDGRIDPCTDFYGFVNGKWAEQVEMPASQSRIGGFEDLRLANEAILQQALRDLRANPSLQTTPGLKLAATYFASGMNLDAIEAGGLKALQPLLSRIDALDKREQLPALLATLNRVQVSAPLGVFVGADAKDVRRHALQIGQAGLGLPDREDYFKSDANSKRLQDAYRVYARRLLTAAAGPNGPAPSEAQLDALYAFETQLAEATKPRAELRDPNARYNPFSPAELDKAAPGFDWSAYLKPLTETANRKGGVERVIVGQPAFLKRVAELAAATPIETWRSYLKLRLLDASADRLPQAFAGAHFDYREATIRGLKAAPPREESVILAIAGRTGSLPLGLTFGEVFVWRAFSPEAMTRSRQLVADVKAAMRQHIQELAWMSAPTKQRALEKLDAMVPKIGAPDQWPDYTGLTLAADDYAGNLLRTAAWFTAKQMDDLEKPVDRLRWSMSPHVVNAQAGGYNSITFPAGILQPPFFNAKADDALNYGGIGMVIGHEITHHFDDQGRQFDAVGNLNDWWTEADASAYKARADRVVKLYGGYEPVPGEPINGRLTLGENISDMAGMPIAFDALQTALKRSGKAEKIDGYTPEQRFFLSNALIWRVKTRPEALVNQLRTDPHSPGKYRVLAPMSNMPAFAKAFSCPAGAPMVAADPITIW
ncbi:M13 family metallopeptidase [Roseateles violae]|uniref:M13 family metallopeptidase n=1 Tax=Roseateles violae TaxID=3058042 RepID=A0ABT8DVE8_9BURK|nr:M13 family metallopeptidase [Pelomonas sp. PFR6]MDN3920869.1 M13 family metallopeptidase [Pelomonas sp. PFR6]